VGLQVRANAHEQQSAISLGAALKALRESRTDLSARALSLAAGLSESYVGKVESGQVEPSVRAFAKIVTHLRVKPGEAWVLLTREADR
jgi:predicted transcriptional regulator